ncbi:MAG: phosphate ABC transporter substrate-binding protein [Melioribacteraceae bacterium]|nr:phosphate ABC transporter substrate-binding protein [Melioribacteraceae bacterium]
MKSFMKQLSILILLIIVGGCSSSTSNVAVIKIKGSDTMLSLTEYLAEAYMKNNPGVSIYVEGGGSSSGIKSLINREADICMASRPLQPEEIQMIASKYSSLGVSYMIAKDGLSIYINPDNPKNNFTIAELKKIFTGKITNWKEVGGKDALIMPVIRTPNSGTYLYFKEHLLEDEEYTLNAITKTTTEKVIEQVAKNVNAIGYGGLASESLEYHASINGVLSTEENIRNDKYPINRYLHFYLLTNPNGVLKDFVDWVLSSSGQKIIKDSGYIPLFEIQS